MIIRRIPALSLTILILLLTLGSEAAATLGSDLSRQRQQFLDAEEALKRGEMGLFISLKKQLTDYPLAPYLDYQALMHRLPDLTPGKFEAFRREASDTPLVSTLRSHWLDHLAKRGDWRRYVSVYRQGNNSKRECRYIQGLLTLGQTKQGLDRVAKLWLSGESQPAACDRVFKTWREAGNLSDELVWRRIALAFERRNIRLARYLGRFLSESEKPSLERWLRVHRNPQEVANTKEFAKDHPYRTAVLTYGLKRLSARDAEQAEAIWKRLRKLYRFDETQAYQIERKIALSMAGDDYARGRKRLSKLNPHADDASTHQRRVRLALANRDWPNVMDWIEAMPEKLTSSERWRYWHAKSIEASGDAERASALFRSLAKERDYHGFLAADYLGLEYHLEHRPLELASDSSAGLDRIPALLRARELFILSRPNDARREWRRVVNALKGDRSRLQSAAKRAQSWGWHDQAIFTSARTGYWDDLELRFPLEHQDLIDDAAQKRQLSNSWVFAVVRQESAFSRDARSPAGALGLMQLMPGTARFIARKIQHPKPKSEDLFEPRTNIALGTAYLARVLNQLDGHEVLATAAYNAGPARVTKWRPEQSQPADIWIETIPFSETRRYVQRVLAYQVIYDSRQGRKPRRLRELMPPITPQQATGSEIAGL